MLAFTAPIAPRANSAYASVEAHSRRCRSRARAWAVSSSEYSWLPCASPLMALLTSSTSRRPIGQSSKSYLSWAVRRAGSGVLRAGAQLPAVLGPRCSRCRSWSSPRIGHRRVAYALVLHVSRFLSGCQMDS
jgi:hypothetical protein